MFVAFFLHKSEKHAQSSCNKSLFAIFMKDLLLARRFIYIWKKDAQSSFRVSIMHAQPSKHPTLPNAGLMLLHRLRRRANVKPTLGERLVSVKPFPAKLIHIHFQSLEVVFRYRDPQLQVTENDSYLFDLRPSICKS